MSTYVHFLENKKEYNGLVNCYMGCGDHYCSVPSEPSSFPCFMIIEEEEGCSHDYYSVIFISKESFDDPKAFDKSSIFFDNNDDC